MELSEKTIESIRFNEFINQVKEVQRTILTPFLPNRFENDAEHSFDMAAMACWMMEVYELNHLDKYKVVQMCLFHDVVEVYAGDMCCLTSSPEELLQLKKREAEAIEAIKIMHPLAKFMYEIIAEFEALESPEAKFVKGLDKTVPAIMELWGGFKSSKFKGINWDFGEKRLVEAAELCPELKPFLDELIPYLRFKYEQIH